MMYEKLSDDARNVLLVAEECARELCQAEVRTEHILVGCFSAMASVTANVLSRLGVTYKEVCDRLAEASRPESVKGDRPRLSSGALRAIEFSLIEADNLRSPAVRSEHLLLGIIREADPGVQAEALSTTAHLLGRLGLRPLAIRLQIVQSLMKDRSISASMLPTIPEIDRDLARIRAAKTTGIDRNTLRRLAQQEDLLWTARNSLTVLPGVQPGQPPPEGRDDGSPTRLTPGTVLGQRYRLVEPIGRGGMGEVWRGTDEVLGRLVAIKLMLPAGLDIPGFTERFRSEARTLATVNHPGVVDVYDYGSDASTGAYLVMEHILGEPLSRTMLRVGRLTAGRAAALVAQAAEALHAAHRAGVVHRDVTPGNLVVRPDGTLVLLDFGIARSAGTRFPNEERAMLGTATYLSPEQASGEEATPTSDIYSLGVVAYYLLAGHPPFEGGEPVTIALRHVREMPPPLPPDVPAEVAAIVGRALAKRPEERWPNAAMFAQAARQFAAMVGTSFPQPAQRPAIEESKRTAPQVNDVRRLTASAEDRTTARGVATVPKGSQIRRQPKHRATRADDQDRLAPLLRTEPWLPDPHRSSVVLLGTSEYQDRELEALPAVENNLRDLAEALTDGIVGGFVGDRTHMTVNPTFDVLTDLGNIAENTDDTLLVYFSGHGLVSSSGELCLGLSGTRVGLEEFSGLRAETLCGALMHGPARYRVLILDCCFSGRALKWMSVNSDMMAAQFELPGACVLTSTSATRLARADVGARNSAFTGELISLIRTGLDVEHELLSLDLIYSSLLRTMGQEGLPLPRQKGTNKVSSLAIVRNAARL